MRGADSRTETMMEITHELVGDLVAAGAHTGPTCEELRLAVREGVVRPMVFEPLIAHDALLEWVISRVMYEIDELLSTALPHQATAVDMKRFDMPLCGSFLECLTEAAMRAAATGVAMTVSWRDREDDSKDWLAVVADQFPTFARVGWSLYLHVSPPQRTWRRNTGCQPAPVDLGGRLRRSGMTPRGIA